MDEKLWTIASSGFMVALLHAVLPTHWLPFVLAGRAQHWSQSRTLLVVAIAGGAHVVFTTLLGALIVLLGIGLSEKIGKIFLWLASGVLVAFGIMYIVRQVRGKGHEHHHSLARLWTSEAERRHVHGRDEPEHNSHLGNRVAIGGLVSMLTFSPCESFLPVYLSGIQFGWTGFALLSTVLAVATLGGMVILTWIAQIGLSRVRVGFFEHYENGIVGGVLCVLGLLVLLLEH